MRQQPSQQPSREAAAFAAALEDFSRAARRARSRIYPGETLSASQYFLVEPLLDAEGPLPVGDLAAAAGVTAPTATRVLDALDRDGLVERTRTEADRRYVRIGLTADGRRVVGAQRRQTVARRRRIFESLEPSERASATRLLSRLAGIYDETL